MSKKETKEDMNQGGTWPTVERPEPKTLAESINAARVKFGKIVKSALNPHFKNKYADLAELLDAVTEPLASEGVLLTQPVLDGTVYTRVSKGDEVLESSLPLPQITDPQKIGSAITYYRRYTLSALLALAAEDDDGNTAAQAPQAPRPVQTPPVPTTSIKKEGGQVSYQVKDRQVEIVREPKESYLYDLSKLDEEKILQVRDYLEDHDSFEWQEGNKLVSAYELKKLKNYEVA